MISHHYKMLHMPWHNCHAMCKISQWSLHYNLYESRVKFPLNLNYDEKSFIKWAQPSMCKANRLCTPRDPVGSTLTHLGRDKMPAFSQTTLSNAFSWMKILEFRLKIHWSLFLRVLLTIFNIPALVLIMAWRRPGDKPLSEPMLVRSLTPICVTRPQWVNLSWHYQFEVPYQRNRYTMYSTMLL